MVKRSIDEARAEGLMNEQGVGSTTTTIEASRMVRTGSTDFA
jgi:hypothetical protein